MRDVGLGFCSSISSSRSRTVSVCEVATSTSASFRRRKTPWTTRPDLVATTVEA